MCESDLPELLGHVARTLVNEGYVMGHVDRCKDEIGV